MITPTPFEIRCALEDKLFRTVGKYATGKNASVFIVQPAQNAAPPVRRIHVTHSVNLGSVQAGELGGRHGIVPRVGVYAVTLSCPPDNTDRYAQALLMAAEIEETFYRAELEIGGERENFGVSPVFCKEPYTENAGELPDKRLGLLVNIPFWVWAGGYND